MKRPPKITTWNPIFWSFAKFCSNVSHATAFLLQKHPWRSLKTPQSQRKVPLVGQSLWAAQRILQKQTFSFAFPRYNKGKVTNAGSASAALNKWIKREGFGEYTLHGFRHSLRDRLREAECPSDIADQIGGWSTKNVGQGYGNGYALSTLLKWMKSIEEKEVNVGFSNIHYLKEI